MNTKQKIIVYTSISLLIFALGRYSLPEKVRVETKIVEVEKKTETKNTDIDTNKHKDTKIIEVIRPDGTKETTTTITEDSKRDKTTSGTSVTESTKDTAETKETSRGASKVTLAGMAGFDYRRKLPVYGGIITKPVLGPVAVGVWALTNATFGASLGLTF